HVVAVPGLAGAAMAATIVRDTPIPTQAEKHHLVFPGIGAQRPAVAEDDRLSLAPVLVIDPRAVAERDRVVASRSDRRNGHDAPPSFSAPASAPRGRFSHCDRTM